MTSGSYRQLADHNYAHRHGLPCRALEGSQSYRYPRRQHSTRPHGLHRTVDNTRRSSAQGLRRPRLHPTATWAPASLFVYAQVTDSLAWTRATDLLNITASASATTAVEQRRPWTIGSPHQPPQHPAQPTPFLERQLLQLHGHRGRHATNSAFAAPAQRGQRGANGGAPDSTRTSALPQQNQASSQLRAVRGPSDAASGSTPWVSPTSPWCRQHHSTTGQTNVKMGYSGRATRFRYQNTTDSVYGFRSDAKVCDCSSRSCRPTAGSRTATATGRSRPRTTAGNAPPRARTVSFTATERATTSGRNSSGGTAVRRAERQASTLDDA